METKEEEYKMPTTYAHDLFGKRVYRRLPDKLQHLIRSNGNLYRIGQHGPDILFYYFISKNPVTQYGDVYKRQRMACADAILGY